MIQPIVWQPYPNQTTGGEFGFGDMKSHLLPFAIQAWLVIWGTGRAFVIPTATSDITEQGKFSLVFSFVALSIRVPSDDQLSGADWGHLYEKLAVPLRWHFILCVNFWRYFHLMGSTILILWGHGQSKSLFLQPRHSQVMRTPTSVVVGERLK